MKNTFVFTGIATIVSIDVHSNLPMLFCGGGVSLFESLSTYGRSPVNPQLHHQNIFSGFPAIAILFRAVLPLVAMTP